jgi:hypothetical protein
MNGSKHVLKEQKSLFSGNESKTVIKALPLKNFKKEKKKRPFLYKFALNLI